MTSSSSSSDGWMLELADCSPFRDMIMTIDHLGIKEAQFNLDEDGFSVSSLCSSRISMVEIRIAASVFKKFELNGRAHTIATSIKTLHKLCQKAMKAGDFLSLGSGDDCLRLGVVSASSGRATTYSVTEMNLDGETFTVPTDEAWECVVFVDANEFDAAVKSMQLVGDTIVLQASVEQGLHMHVLPDGDSKGADVRIKPKKGLLRVQMQNNEDKETQPMTFALRFLVMFAKDAGTEEVEVHLDADKPIKVAFEQKDGSFRRHYLAPKAKDGDGVDAPVSAAPASAEPQT
jgi:proliferating cell nuclear antigen PCNA